MNDDLEELKELGSGTFGTVYHGKWRGTDVAIKRIKKTCFMGRSSELERLVILMDFSCLLPALLSLLILLLLFLTLVNTSLVPGIYWGKH